ncbi:MULTISPECIES: hypothetical protein [unclassified Streptomyces]|uniref:hypothetical protein n=1 Tax=unclassified Streptomyces TaxID=2593676 RepID=UPI0003A15BB2|nr:MULTISPECIES: hypothetical protein [unclassified Streptomyces]MYT28513.1 hypothetical protein [Streptomyces sp. SID8354]
MTTRRTLTAVGLTAATLGAGLAAAAPASAGGIGVILSPSFDNSCANQHAAANANADTVHGRGTAGGLSAAIPADTPLNHCGGAELPLSRNCTDSGASSEPGSMIGATNLGQNLLCEAVRNNLNNPNVNILG